MTVVSICIYQFKFKKIELKKITSEYLISQKHAVIIIPAKKTIFFVAVSVAFSLSITLSLRKFFAQFKIASLFSMVVKFFISSDKANTCISYEMTRLLNHDSAHKH